MYWPSKEEREEFNEGVESALTIFTEMQKIGIFEELQGIVLDHDNGQKINQWVDMAVILSIKNNNLHMTNPFSAEDDTMLINGHEGIRDLVLKGFVYGLYWRTKELETKNLEKIETENLEKMWKEGTSNDECKL